jgi:hypothetical protein
MFSRFPSISFHRINELLLNLRARCFRSRDIAGKPGTLAKVYPMKGLAPLIENWGRHGDRIGLMAGYGACNGSTAATQGWKLESSGKLVAPQAGMSEPQCLSTHNYQYDVDCPPPTLNSGPVGCGPVIVNCSSPAAEEGTWKHDTTTGLLTYKLNVPPPPPPPPPPGPPGPPAPPSAACVGKNSTLNASTVCLHSVDVMTCSVTLSCELDCLHAPEGCHHLSSKAPYASRSPNECLRYAATNCTLSAN